MKKYLPILLLFVIPFYYSCVGNDGPNYSDVASSIYANNNGTGWSASLFDTLKNDTLTLHARTKLQLLRLQFPVSGSSYNLTVANGQYFNYDNTGTNIIKTFKLDPSYPNTVTAIANNTVNSINEYVTGQFKSRFVIDSAGVNTVTLAFDTVTFSNGQFTAAYK